MKIQSRLARGGSLQNGDFTMSTSKEYMQFVLDQLEEFPDVTYRKMFGEYMVYLQGRPVLLVCDNCAMVKKAPRAGGADARRAGRPAL